MAQLAKRDLCGTVLVNGEQFNWRLEREPQWCTADGYRGVSILVERAKDLRSLLYVEYPFPSRWKGFGTQGRKVQRPQIQQSDIALQISNAIKRGYDPDRNGKPFLFLVEITVSEPEQHLKEIGNR